MSFDLFIAIDAEGCYDHVRAELSDVVSYLTEQGAEVVGVQIDGWGIPVLGYGDTITQEAYDSDARFVVLRIPEGIDTEEK